MSPIGPACREPTAVSRVTGARLGGKKTSDIDRVPAFWPDNETVRNDILDYAYEAEDFDRHLGRMIADLEKRAVELREVNREQRLAAA